MDSEHEQKIKYQFLLSQYLLCENPEKFVELVK